MAVTNYFSVGDRLLGEETNGVSTGYMTDHLGSVVGSLSGGAVQNRYVYSPYGRLVSKTGTAPDPRFMWNGGTGSRATGLDHAENYNRRRHYSSSESQWTTRDPLWPRQRPYGYVHGRVTTMRDPLGLAPACPDAPPPNSSFFSACVYGMCASFYSYEFFSGPGELASAPTEVIEPSESEGTLQALGSAYSHYKAGASICDAAKNIGNNPYCDCLKNATFNSGDIKSRSIYWICSTQSGKHGGCAGASGFMDCWACCMDKFGDNPFDFCSCERNQCGSGSNPDYMCQQYPNYNDLCDNYGPGMGWPGGWN